MDPEFFYKAESNRKKQRVRLGEAVSGWKKMTSHDLAIYSVLWPTLFVLFINDLPQIVESPVAFFADDAEVFTEIQSDEVRQKLQQNIDCQEVAVPFNESKCYHTYIHTYIQYIHTCRHACMHACTHARTHVRSTHARTHTHTHTYIHTVRLSTVLYCFDVGAHGWEVVVI